LLAKAQMSDSDEFVDVPEYSIASSNNINSKNNSESFCPAKRPQTDGPVDTPAPVLPQTSLTPITSPGLSSGPPSKQPESLSLPPLVQPQPTSTAPAIKMLSPGDNTAAPEMFDRSPEEEDARNWAYNIETGEKIRLDDMDRAFKFTTLPADIKDRVCEEKSLPIPADDKSRDILGFARRVLKKKADSLNRGAASGVVPVKTHKKTKVIMNGLKEVQSFKATQTAIWTAAFSLDGKYLAAGCQDSQLLVWQVTLLVVITKSPA
jgi:hypothetical protein